MGKREWEADRSLCNAIHRGDRKDEGWRVTTGAPICANDRSSSRYLLVGTPHESKSDTRWIDPYVIWKSSCEMGTLWGLCFPTTHLVTLADILATGVIEESVFRHLNAWIRTIHAQGQVIGDVDPTTLYYAAGENLVQCCSCMQERGRLPRWLQVSPYSGLARYRFLPRCDVAFSFDGVSIAEHQLWDWTYLEHLLYKIRLGSNEAEFLQFRRGGAYRGVAQRKACAAACAADCHQ